MRFLSLYFSVRNFPVDYSNQSQAKFIDVRHLLVTLIFLIDKGRQIEGTEHFALNEILRRSYTTTRRKILHHRTKLITSIHQRPRLVSFMNSELRVHNRVLD